MQQENELQPVMGQAQQQQQPVQIIYVQAPPSTTHHFLLGWLSSMCCGLAGWLLYFCVPTQQLVAGLIAGTGSNLVLSGMLFVAMFCHANTEKDCEGLGHHHRRHHQEEDNGATSVPSCYHISHKTKAVMQAAGVLMAVLGCLLILLGVRKNRMANAAQSSQTATMIHMQQQYVAIGALETAEPIMGMPVQKQI